MASNVSSPKNSVGSRQAAYGPQRNVLQRAIAPILKHSSLRWGAIWLLSLIGGTMILMHQAIAQVNTHAVPQVYPALTDVTKLVRSPDVSLEASASPLSIVPKSQTNLGHLPYPVVDETQLIVVGSYSQDLEQRFEKLNHDAGLALLRMLDAARADGVWIIPISGFRDYARQDMLFQLQKARVGSAQTAARAVAPPGYSEHHTGYAVDLADGLARSRDVSLSFGQTDAFKWLTRRAQEFGFELSFPADNAQGVNYEPWHWRYVGSSDAIGMFSLARSF